MAQIATGVIGAAIGYVASGFNPAGAYWGWTIGVAVGTVLFPPEGVDQVGPQLGDKGVQTSTYGVPIAAVYGTIRTAGNVIWATDIVEKKHVEKSGGKGAPSSTQTTYSYYGNLAIGICEGEADILRMWANGKLIYDISSIGSGSGGTISSAHPFVQLFLIKGAGDGINFTFYRGTETQLPDPLIEANEGVGQVPAHRGLCYIVFDELPLADYGNGIPQLTFEVTRVAQNLAYSVAAINPDATYHPGLTYADWTRALIVRTKTLTSIAGPITELSFLDMDTMTDVVKTPEEVSDIAVIRGTIGLLPNSRRLVLRGEDPAFYYVEVSLDTFAEVDRVVDTMSSALVNATDKDSGTHTGFSVRHTEFIAWTSWADHLRVYRSGVGDIGFASSPAAPGDTGLLPMRDNGVSGGFYSIRAFGGSDITIKRFEVSWASVSLGTYDWDESTLVVIPSTDVDPLWVDGFQAGPGFMWDRVDDNIIIIENHQTAGGGDNPRMFKVDINTGSILWVSDQIDLTRSSTSLGPANQSVLEHGVYAWVSDSEVSYAIDTATGEVTQVESGYVEAADPDGQIFSSRAGVASQTKELFFIGRKIGLPTTVKAVADDLTSRVGLVPVDVNTTLLEPLVLPGYMLSRNMQAKAAFESLANLYLIDVIEVDDVLEFIPRGGVSAGTLIEQDLIVDQSSGGSIAETRATEIELPVEIAISYMDQSNNYSTVTHRARRIISPKPEVYSTNKLNLSMAATLEPDFVKAQAQKLLMASWIERITRSMVASRSFLKYVPSDIITLTLDDGRTVRTRLTTAEIGRDLNYSLFSREEDSSQHVSSATAEGGSGVFDRTIRTGALLRLILVRSPLLRDTDDIGRSYSKYYYFMGVVGVGSFGFGLLYQSSTGDGFEQIGSITSEPTWGYAVNVLPDIAWDAKWQQDNTNILNVSLKNESTTLQSVTFDQLLIGDTNAFALIRSDGEVELMKFQTVVAEADGTFTLSGLLRGRRGTDQFTGAHSGGDTFVMLETSGAIATTDLPNLDVDKYMKAVPAGSFLENADTLIEANPGNDLKPYAPVWIESDGALWGTDITFTWIRRTRLAGGLRDGTGTVPLNEDTEEYSIDIYDGVTLLRTVVGLVTPTYVYTVAQQSADTGGTPVTLDIVAYQISAQVGRGFPSYQTPIGV